MVGVDLVERAGGDFECDAADFIGDDGWYVERNRFFAHNGVVDVLDDRFNVGQPSFYLSIMFSGVENEKISLKRANGTPNQPFQISLTGKLILSKFKFLICLYESHHPFCWMLFRRLANIVLV